MRTLRPKELARRVARSSPFHHDPVMALETADLFEQAALWLDQWSSMFKVRLKYPEAMESNDSI